jgi:formylglycine-generating enzyme required for sulfatase activity
MRTRFWSQTAWCGAMALTLVAGASWANNISVTNVAWTTAGAGLSDIQFDLSWENSWRASWTEDAATNVTASALPVENWDAAWVFLKYRVENGTAWQHATLSVSAGDHVKPAEASLNVGLTDGGTKGIGVFVYRSATGDGAVNYQNVKLRWLHGVDGVANPEKADLEVEAIEMVYVAAGPFKVGDGHSTLNSRFRAGATVSTPFLVDAAWDGPVDAGTDARKIADQANRLWALSSIAAGTLHNDFPTGYQAFYCMKYSITQGQYVDFLNKLTPQQAGYRAYTAGAKRNTISVVGGVYSASAPDRACNFLMASDLAAYACWAGLRPMTELEYEKACRGPLNPVLNEQAWGTTTVTAPSGLQGVDGSGSEYYTAGNSRFDAAGPLRVGIFARAATTRALAGASYWGIMELSGNVSTFTATTGTTAGQTFRGLHGTGVLNASGGTTVAWPFGGTRGNYYNAASDGPTSSRRGAVDAGGTRLEFTGGRAVRKAP